MKIESINNVLKIEYENEPYTLEDLKLIESFLKIIKMNNIKFNEPIYKNIVDINKSIDYSLSFIETIDTKYREVLMYVLSEKLIEFKQTNYDSLSKLVMNDGKKMINFEVTNTIEDSYTFTHEGFHYINMDSSRITSNWWLITETISMVAEALQKKYFDKKNMNIPEYKYNEINNYFGVLEKATIIDFEIELLKEYTINKKITFDFMHSLLKDKDDNYIYLACTDLEDMLKTGYMNYSMLQKYIISAVLSTRLLNRIKKDNSYKSFIELNDNCNDMTFVDSLKYLGLLLKDEKKIILSDDSLNELNREYFERVLTLKK